MAVRTKRLFGPAQAGSAAVVYTCPAGKTAILKWIAAGYIGGSSNSVAISLNGSTSGARVALISLASGATVVGAETWVVLHPGDQLYVTSLSGQTAISGHGAELDGVAP